MFQTYMQFKFLIMHGYHWLACLFLVICLLATTKGKEKSQEKHKVIKKAEEKKEESKKHGQHKTEPNNDDYDTTQGYPILFPETHMMSLKRNLTASKPNVSLVANDLNDSASNKSNSIGETPKCNKTVDLLFVLDSSESVKYSNWKIIIQFVKDLCNRFHLHSTRVGVIRYASDAEVALELTEFNSTDAREVAIDNIFYKTGGTRTDIALKKAAEMLHIEEQRSQVLMLVTDGPTNRLEIDKNHFVEGKDLVAGPADRLKEVGVALFCIGVEPDSETPEEIDTMKEEMSLIASEPTKMHLFMSDGYRELERKVELISNAACVVNGAWSIWSEYSPCSVTCGYGTKVRMRTCNNPSPENNGADCTGPRVEIEECDLGPCTVGPSEKFPIVSVRHLNLKDTEKKIQSEKEKNENNTNIDLVPETIKSSAANVTNITNIEQKENATISNNSIPTINASVTDHDSKPMVTKWFDNSTGKGEEKSSKQEEKNIHSGECIEGFEELKLNDTQYNASSIYSHDTDDEYVKREYAPQNAKLNNQINGGGWCAEHKFALRGDKNQFLQLDLGKKMTVDAVATQGSHLLENWVKSYNLRYSDDGISWEYYNKNPLEGNSDRETEKKNMLSPPIDTRYIQLNPIEWNEQNEPEKHEICMRAALYKCRGGMIAPVKRGIIQKETKYHFESNLVIENNTPRGVVLKEREWSHFPDQKTKLTLYERRSKRQLNHSRHKGHKRIFTKIRKTAKNIMKNIGRKMHVG